MKKIYLWGWFHSSSQESIKELEKEGQIQVLYWYKEKGCDVEFNLNLLINSPLELPSPLSHIPCDIQDLVSKHFIKFADMYSRVNCSAELSVEELEHLFILYAKYWYEKIINNPPDLILFSAPPHFGGEYILYLVAQAMNIPLVFTYQSIFENIFFASNNIDEIHNILSSSPVSAVPNWNIDKKWFYMKDLKIKSSYRLFLQNLLSIPFKKTSPITLVQTLLRYKSCRKFEQQYEKYSLSEDDIDFSKKYIFFPLQLQPELTTSAFGGVFSNQLNAIEKLFNILPSDWYVYVKENPKQTYQQRGGGFYKRLKSIPRVIYVSKKVDTKKLISNSQFVSSITGTAGWESIKKGKPALVFGNPWYKTFPGVYTYRSDLDINEILSYSFDTKKFDNHFNSFISSAHQGIIDPMHILNFPDYSSEANKKWIISFLRKIIARF